MFNKNKKKPDSKIRFQNSRFQSRLNAQRNYKRSPKKIPTAGWPVFLAKIGLGGWVSKLITAAVLLLLIYIVFIPNFLFVKNLQINNPASVELSNNQGLINAYLQKYNPWPQKNLLLLSAAKLKAYLLNNDSKIQSVDKITKKYPSTLIVNLTPRTDRFLIQTPSSTYFSLSDDGLITGQVFPDASGTLPNGLLFIKLDDGQSLSYGQSPIPSQKISFIQALAQQLPKIASNTITSLEITDFESPYITTQTSAGYSLKLDSTSDLSLALSQLEQLLSQLQAGDIKNLYYIDMRFGGKAYVCYKNTTCSTPLILPTTPATTTPSSTN